MTNVQRPARDESAAYYFTYIDQVAGDDIGSALSSQVREFEDLFAGMDEKTSRHRYAPDKWSIREVLGHINDCERLFVFRALWFARGFDSPLPSFDQNVAIASARSDERTLQDLLQEFKHLRAATLSFVQSLPADAWSRSGLASDNRFTVRALMFITAGHSAHHLRLVRERYLA